MAASTDGVEAQASQLAHMLMGELPGDLGSLLRSIVSGGGAVRESFSASTPLVGPLAWTAQILAVCCAAYGKPMDQAIPVAACLDVLGIVSCILDAAEDNDPRLQNYMAHRDRTAGYRSDPHAVAAIVSNAGVTLIGVAWQALLEHGPRYGLPAERIVAIGQLLATQWTTICEAQHRDLTVGRSPALSLDDHMEIVAGKAGAMGGTVCEAGAILADQGMEERTHWYTMGRERAIAQQLSDDCRDLDQDLARGQQISHPVLYGLQVGDADVISRIQRLLTHVRGVSVEAGEARRELITTLEDVGAVQYALVCQLIHEGQALQALQELDLPDPWKTQLDQWIRAGNPAHAIGVASPF